MRKLLWAAFALAPLAVAARLLDVTPVVLFVLGVLALIPIAWLIGRSTEEIGYHTGSIAGGIVNATFGNAVELFVAFFAISSGLFDVVRGSLSGSIVSTLLLTLGVSLCAGRPQRIDRPSALVSLGIVAAAATAFLLYTIPYRRGTPADAAPAEWIFPVSAVLLALYCVALGWQLHRRRQQQADGGAQPAEWSLRVALAVLGAACLAAGFLAEIITGSIEQFSEQTNLSVFFVSLVLIAIVSDATEHGGAILAASDGQMPLAVEVTLQSSAQIAAFLIPAIAMLTWIVDPMPLPFTNVELLAIAASLALTLALLADGCVSPRRGATLVTAYAIAAGAFYLFT